EVLAPCGETAAALSAATGSGALAPPGWAPPGWAPPDRAAPDRLPPWRDRPGRDWRRRAAVTRTPRSLVSGTTATWTEAASGQDCAVTPAALTSSWAIGHSPTGTTSW